MFFIKHHPRAPLNGISNILTPIAMFSRVCKKSIPRFDFRAIEGQILDNQARLPLRAIKMQKLAKRSKCFHGGAIISK